MLTLNLKIMEEVTITLLLKDKKIMSLLGPNTSWPPTIWWDREMQVNVPKKDWDEEKVTGSTVHQYIRPGKYWYT